MTNNEKFIKFLTELIQELETTTVVKPVNVVQEPQTIELSDFVSVFAQKFEMSIPDTHKMLQHLYDINPGACISLFAKEIAIFLDLRYPDHISELDEYFVLSLTDGCIHTCNTSIKNHQCLALFRTLDDAKFACKVLKPMLKAVYGKQKNKKH